MLFMKSFNIFSSLNNSNNLNLSELMNRSTIFLYDLRPAKTLNESNGETYKTVIMFMKNNNMTINFENILKLINDFNTVYNKKIVKAKHMKKINVISELYLREKVLSFFKNTLISYGFCVYYLTKAPFFSDTNTILNKRNVIIFSIIILALIVGFIYTHSKNKDHSIEIFNRVNELEKTLKSFNTTDVSKEGVTEFNIDRIIIDKNHNSSIYHELIYDMLSDMYVKITDVRNVLTIQINPERMEECVIDNNAESKIYEISEDENNKEDIEEMLEIIMSPQEDLEERIEQKLENIEQKIDQLDHKSDIKSDIKSEEDKKMEKIQQEEITLDEKVDLEDHEDHEEHKLQEEQEEQKVQEEQEPVKTQVKPGRKPRSTPAKTTKKQTKPAKQSGRKPKNVKK